MRRARLFILATAIGLLPVVSWACPDDQYEQCGPFGIGCVCLPKVGGTVGKEAERIKNETRAQTAGPILEQWLVASRNSAIGSASPIPAHVRAALSGFVDERVLNRVRYKVGDNGILNLAGLTIAYGDFVTGQQAQAVALMDLVVFRDHHDAMNNLGLWVHELVHVRQYMDMGVRDFSIRYARNSGDLEGPAYQETPRFFSWSDGRGGRGGRGGAPPPGLPPPPIGAPPPGLPPPPLGLAPGTQMQPCGCWGPAAGFAPEGRCRSGSVRPMVCAGFCNMGGQPYAWVCS